MTRNNNEALIPTICYTTTTGDTFLERYCHDVAKAQQECDRLNANPADTNFYFIDAQPMFDTRD